MKRIVMLFVSLLCLGVASPAFSQSSNAILSGTVADAAGALIPGVTVTATNTATGVVATSLTNETGTYNFGSLLPGVYTVSSELPGFQTRTFTEVRLGNAAQARLNFTLEVASLNTTVEVTVSADRLLIESTSSVGTVLPEQAVRNLPVVGNMGNDVLSLVRTLPGLNLADDLVLEANDSKVAGVSAANAVVQRDGVDASAAGRWPAGFQGATIMNPELVGEVKMILAPVDAEVGRGNSQVQILTKSGTNQYRGSAVWNVTNTALDPNTWANKRVAGTPVERSWSNVNEYTLSMGGPIVKNKTFFFALWDGLLPASRSNQNAQVLTPCAQRGIFRYYDNWSNGNALTVTQASATTPRIAVVNQSGNPMAPGTNPNGSAHNGVLRYASVFGPLQNNPTRPDCSDAVVQGSPWDANRSRIDPTGYVTKLLGVMPPVNNYEIGDGLNTGGHRWVRSDRGSVNRFGFGNANVRKQINLKIDHNFNQAHKVNGGWSWEKNRADYASGTWPTRFPGTSRRLPQVLTMNFTSTLSPTLLNEARFGMRRTGTNTQPGIAREDEVGTEARAFVPNIGGIPVLPQLGDPQMAAAGTTAFGLGFCVCGGQPNMGNAGGLTLFNGNIMESTRLYTYNDTVSWTRGVHSFKFGGETRIAKSLFGDDVQGNFWSTFGRAHGGETPLSPIQGINNTNIPGLQGTTTTGNNQAMRSLLSMLSGSLSRVTQLYWVGSADRLDTWDDYLTDVQRERELNQNEVSVFFKDDWKAHRDLTINLGLRWDYYGVPWVSDGLTSSPIGGGASLFGWSGRGFENWMSPSLQPRAENTGLQFVGPDSPNPNLRAWKKDFNNFGPAIGFAWQVPWFGAGRTTLRGGYQISFLPGGGGRFQTINTPLATPPGSSYQGEFNGASGDLEYLDLTKLNRIVPVPIPSKPMEPILVTDRTATLQAFDPNYTTPYVQNMTLALTRQVGRNVTVDLRYIGTLSRKLYDTVNLNSSNFLYNGLKEAFDSARAGGESELLDRMFRGINIAGTGFGAVGTVVNGVAQTGALHLRSAAASTLRNDLANGDYNSLATKLSTLNYAKAGGINSTLPDIPVNVTGAVLRYNNFPENFIKTNPQFNTATLHTNMSRTNYHSLQSQVTLRPAAGLNLQASYTWSKLLGLAGGYTNPVDRAGDYTLQNGDRRHDFKTNGSFELPVGPNAKFFSGSSGVVARLIEDWQFNWIINLGSGAATNIAARSMLYANGVPDVVGPFDPKKGKVQWQDGALAGNYFGGEYTAVRDPQCGTIAPSMQTANLCTLNAIADSSGRIVLQNPLPGTRGNLGQNIIELPGAFSFDAGMSKGFRISESRRLELRLDTLNIFNHPQPADPTLDINSTTAPFGNIATKTGTRQFQAQIRLQF